MFDPWVGKIPWRRACQPTPLFLPGESHGQRSLEGYSPWGCKELDTTEATEHTRTHCHSVQVTWQGRSGAQPSKGFFRLHSDVKR